MFRGKDAQGKPKYIGSSKAKVIDNRDPLNRGRILVDHPILGNTAWIPYLVTPGYFSMPQVNDLVFITCESGEPEYAYAWGNVIKGERANPDLPDKFKRTVPTNRGLHTPGGNFIELDDGEASPGADPKYSSRTTKSRGIRITSTSGHTISIMDDPDSGTETITIVDKSGDGIVFDSANKQVDLVSKGKMNISASEDLTASTDTNAKFSGTAMTTVGDAGSPTNVDGSVVKLAGGGPGVARLGDRAFGIGNLGAPVSSTIIQGSFKVTSG